MVRPVWVAVAAIMVVCCKMSTDRESMLVISDQQEPAVDLAIQMLNASGHKWARRVRGPEYCALHSLPNEPEINVVVVDRSTATGIGAVDTCLAYPSRRSILCPEGITAALEQQVADELLLVRGNPILITQLYGVEDSTFALAVGRIGTILVHERGHILASDPDPHSIAWLLPVQMRDDEIEVTESLCKEQWNFAMVREERADQSAAAWLNTYRKDPVTDEGVDAHTLALLAEAATILDVSATQPTRWTADFNLGRGFTREV